MTKRKPLPEINKCYWCKRKVLSENIYDGDYWTECENKDCRAEGPTRKTERGAINAWNNPCFR